MKPAEAKQKLCHRDFRQCRADQCMAWEWLRLERRRVWMPDDPVPYAEPPLPEPPRPDGLPADWTWYPAEPEVEYGRWIEPSEDALARSSGVCGLLHRKEEE